MRSLVLLNLKTQLKLMASLIKDKKPIYRQAQSERSKTNFESSAVNKNCDTLETEVARLRYEFRHSHIVYCLIRGKKMEQIERRKPCKAELCEKRQWCCNKPDQKKIDQLLAHYMELISKETQHVLGSTETHV